MNYNNTQKYRHKWFFPVTHSIVVWCVVGCNQMSEKEKESKEKINDTPNN